MRRQGADAILGRERYAAGQCIRLLESRGYQVFSGEHQSGTVSFVPKGDCEEMAEKLGQQDIAVRAGLHCAPLAHQSAGTAETGTVRISFGHDASYRQIMALKQGFERIND